MDENIDIDLSALSVKGRKRLVKYVKDHCPLMGLRVCFIILTAIISCGFGWLAEQVFGSDSGMVLTGFFAGAVIGCFIYYWRFRNEKNQYQHFIEDACKNGKYPICFECKHKLNGNESDKCPNCGADIRLVLTEIAPGTYFPSSYKGFWRRQRISIYSSMFPVMIFYLLGMYGVVMTFQCWMITDDLKIDEEYDAMSQAIRDYEDGELRYYEAVMYDQRRKKSDKEINGIPVIYKQYETIDSPFLWMFPYVTTGEKSTKLFVKAYNAKMGELIRDKAPRPVKLPGGNKVSYRECGCGECVWTEFRSKFIFGDTVESVKDKKIKGKIKSLSIKDDGSVCYGIELPDGKIIKDIPEKNLEIIKYHFQNKNRK